MQKWIQYVEAIRNGRYVNVFNLNYMVILGLQQDLNKHIEYAHKGRLMHLCSVCGQMCSNESSLRNHLLSHQGKKFHCNLCPKQFFTKRGYDLHCNQHQNPMPVKR